VLIGGEKLIEAAASLAAILLLILLAARLVRLLQPRLPALRGGAPGAGALALRGSLALDARRRLHVVDIGGQQALVLTGGTTDVVVGLPHRAP
jgi:flagellar biogenesis protein FliO